MSYRKDFEQHFLEKTLDILNDYKGDKNVTLLLNCLVGLLIVPYEIFYEKIPYIESKKLKEYGISLESISVLENPTLRQVIEHLRNAVAHFRIEPYPQGQDVEGFIFEDRWDDDSVNFKAKLTVKEIETFVKEFAEYLMNT